MKNQKDTDLTMTELGRKTTSAFRSQGIISLVGKILSFLSSIILARLLFPEDYGLFAIALIVTNLIQLFANFGFQSFLIQAPELDEETINLCYTFNKILAWSLGIIVMVGAWLWPNPPPGLKAMLVMYGVQIGLSSMTYIPLALLKRELNFERSSRAELIYSIVSMTGRVGFAAANLGALCFPAGDLFGTIARVIYVKRSNPLTMKIIWPNIKQTREVLWFGIHSSSVGLASLVANQIDKLLIMSHFSVAQVGLYTFGSSNTSLFYNALIVPQAGVFQAAYARCRNELEEARSLLLRSTRLVFSAALPVHALLMLESERIITVVFTDKWLNAAPLMQVFAVDYSIRSMISGVTGIQISFGFAREAAITKWQNSAVFVIALLIATVAEATLTGYAVAYVTASILCACHNFIVNSKIINLKCIDFLKNISIPLMLALISTIIWYLIQPLSGSFLPWQGLLVQATAWVLPYALLTLIFNASVLRVFSSLVFKRV